MFQPALGVKIKEVYKRKKNQQGNHGRQADTKNISGLAGGRVHVSAAVLWHKGKNFGVQIAS